MRLTDADDVKYIYAAWRLGAKPLDAIKCDNNPDTFTTAFADHVAQRYHVAYTLVATPPGKDTMPVGVVFGVKPFHGEPVLWIGDFLWFPWASKRNMLEAAVHFMNQMRKEQTLIGFAEPEVIPFFEHICRYGVTRRAGTFFDIFTEGPRAIFQTRKPYIAGKTNG
jgi:hypothetical protein